MSPKHHSRRAIILLTYQTSYMVLLSDSSKAILENAPTSLAPLSRPPPTELQPHLEPWN